MLTHCMLNHNSSSEMKVRVDNRMITEEIQSHKHNVYRIAIFAKALSFEKF